MTDDESRLDWRGAVPVARAFDDPYYSLDDGLAETRHVFLTGNDLPTRLRPGFHVAELGFGTGLNAMALAAICEMPVHLTSFEAFPLTRDQIARATLPWQAQLGPQRAALLDGYDPTGTPFAIGPLRVELRIGLVAETLPAWEGSAEAWFLDGFAPARNPEMWREEIMAEVARHTAPGGSFATYTSAGAVRRALTAAGFAVRKVPGHGRKREMSVGRLATPS
ncbi:tRNA (5-methylaminomethyl-2-thiouridine)(34)-methyltransferase MnmD [Roseobacter sp. HKCCA0434]|uniref:tRNA (5-methylaminomethyl-2-thiouridine)(34)-methyltransferase MnmD n=1 Tax=Roseobacter sp. HKCCA0434 TaxID=3079297 RepID=UPI002905B511|nr:tRNA (5-methylaminomethyl-2-thiouridine)(34)-methyltransferase MnmD [Roseobacter sp. HKCCA0434]